MVYSSRVIIMIMSLKNVCKTYKEANFKLENISFDVEESKSIGLIGKNGSGKSTLLKMMNGLVTVDRGEIFYKGLSLSSLSEKDLRAMRKKVAYIFQNANLLDEKSVYYHLSLVFKLNKERVNEEEIEEVLSFFRLSHLKHSRTGELSGGEKQKVAIATALLQKPEILLCDEISASLDTKSEKEIFDHLLTVKKEKKIALVLISHNLSILKNCCDRVLLLSSSGIREEILPKKSAEIDTDKKYLEYVKEYLLK